MEKVLHVEDEENWGTVVEIVLRAEVTRVCDPDEVQQLLQAPLDFDVIIVDGEVPRVNTVQFVRELLDKGFGGPIIGLSANLQALELLSEAGCTAIVSKVSLTLADELRAAITPPPAV